MNNDINKSFRLIAGILLFYIDYKLISDKSIATASGAAKFGMIGAIVVFAVVGVYLVYDYIRKCRAEDKKKAEEKAGEAGRVLPDKTPDGEAGHENKE